ncbi:MAG: hypothetical protein ACSHX6_04125 [Akkermansiaceae bacterium]
MLFSKEKRLQRDRNAGLVFRWRGGYGLNRGGSTIAFVMTSMIFAAGFVMLNVYAKPNTVPSRYRATMIQLGEMDDDLTWWVEKNSPNLPLWSGNDDEPSDARVSELLREEIYDAHGGTYRYEDVEMQQIEVANEEVYSLRTRSLPSLRRFSVDQGDGVEVMGWKLLVTGEAGLEERLPADLDYGDEIPANWRGNSARFIVAVDAGGKVLSVNPSEWTEDEVVRGFEDWIQAISFKPVKGEGEEAVQIVTGVITLSLDAVVKTAEQEVQP